ncbi:MULTISPECIES: hypothetical protein [unclassified Streptomyces]|uniref:hypothetical protein n=1 Tax=Streptomyces TaxID=1883 RepID=UPI00136CE6BB|nr:MULTISPECIES: hypothetical protein [unclassified Streptomyces]NEA03650.1 hypothetical protein [Streptomyces sp. SID10116]MYY84862.1 hypothetical protein [Streptomyces sp. SID335]MYZ18780.1 hypothetical protein [Streptomyces sp. SID337]NDZ92031.1 hypothetical protein [Streptomyces sp. SID10115]NEB50347.1 hypothetical protein [Streptomyces sp. SID339]
MALVHREQFAVLVERYLLWLQDADEEIIDAWSEGGRGLVVAEHGRVDIASGGHTHWAAFMVEVWDSPPEPDHRAPWEATGEAELDSPSGHLRFHTAGGPDKHEIDLGAAGRRWRLRAHAMGQKEVTHLAQQGVPDGVERFLLQFWPV